MEGDGSRRSDVQRVDLVDRGDGDNDIGSVQRAGRQAGTLGTNEERHRVGQPERS